MEFVRKSSDAGMDLTTEWKFIPFPSYATEWTVINKATTSIFVSHVGGSDRGDEIGAGDTLQVEMRAREIRATFSRDESGNVRQGLYMRGAVGGEAYEIHGR